MVVLWLNHGWTIHEVLLNHGCQTVVQPQYHGKWNMVQPRHDMVVPYSVLSWTCYTSELDRSLEVHVNLSKSGSGINNHLFSFTPYINSTQQCGFVHCMYVYVSRAYIFIVLYTQFFVCIDYTIVVWHRTISVFLYMSGLHVLLYCLGFTLVNIPLLRLLNVC